MHPSSTSLSARPRAGRHGRRLVALASAGAALGASLAVAVATPASAASSAVDGPDVSSYQHPNGAVIHWGQVRAAGHEFAIVKATEGGAYRNPWFGRDFAGARSAGLVAGSYHFAHPGYPVVRTARAQADRYVAVLGDRVARARTLPPALDLELTGGLSRADLVTWAQAFLLRVRHATGRTPMLYTYPGFYAYSLGDPAALNRFPLWLASYGSRPTVASTLWQYTSGASVAGIKGRVDMSRLLDTAGWGALSDGRVVTAWSAAAPGAPQGVWASAGDGAATISWLPGDAGSQLPSSYTVTASPGGAHVTVPATTHVVTLGGLTNGTAYTFTVAATSAAGTGPGTSSNTVTPLLPTRLRVDVPAPVGYGSDVVVRARLVAADTGAALAGQSLSVAQRAPGGRWTSVGTVQTGPHGWAKATVPAATTSMDVRFRLVAPTGVAPAHGVVAAVVRSIVHAGLAPAQVEPGTPVVLAGTVEPGAAGVTVSRERLTARGWREVGTAQTDAAGGYSFTWTPAKTASGQTIVYRVVAAPFAGLAAGTSRRVSLTVA